MKKTFPSRLLYYSSFILIIFVWVANGLVAKLLNFVPRHEQIVEVVLNTNHARTYIILIGVGELLMAIWVFIRWKSNWCAWSQLGIILLMNILEFFIVPDLLLFGRLNVVFAIFFCTIIYLNEFKWKENV